MDVNLLLHHPDTSSGHSSHIIFISYALCICILARAWHFDIPMWAAGRSTSDEPGSRLAHSVPDNSLLNFRMEHLRLLAQRAPELTDNRHKCAQMKLPHYVCLMLLSIQRSLPCPSFFSLHPSSVSPPGSWAYFSASHIVSLEHTHLHLSSGAVNLYHPVPRGSSVTTDIKAGFPFSKQHIQYIFSIYGWSISVDIVWGRQGLMM